MITKNKILNAITTFTRTLPPYRKFNEIYNLINTIFLKLGADSIVITKMEDGTNMIVDLTTRTERNSYYTGRYDKDVLELIHNLIDSNSTFLDIGANIGYYSVSIANHFKTQKSKGKVISFEPFEGNFLRLNENIDINKLNSFCILNNFGLSDKSDEALITLRDDFRLGSSTGNASIQTGKKIDDGYKTTPIKLKSLDDVWETNYLNLGRIDFIKMDIEGHEDFCLKGAQQTINKHRPTIFMEVAKPYYIDRGVELDKTFFPLIPKNYSILYLNKNKWLTISSLNECAAMDNVFLVPNEKLVLKRYNLFKY
ncbi:MAG: FkbM family methyltransferase [Urechidicola sp.]|nr:FkbM family methyltransferase [Urechidicola sp.]